MVLPENLDEGDIVRGAEEYLKKPRPQSSDTDNGLPEGVEYPLSFKVRDFLIDKGYILADYHGRRTRADDETNSFGLLLPDNSAPSRYPWMRFLRKYFERPAKWVGTLYFDEKENDGWLMRVYGRNNIDPLLSLVATINDAFSKSVPIRLSSTYERTEANIFGLRLPSA